MTRKADKSPIKRHFPPWLRVRVQCGGKRREVANLIHDLSLNTVCEEAQCPNLAECWHQGTATFMILGASCTRSCAFCAIASGTPTPPDPEEPAHVAEACRRMSLQFAVLTSVTRDDLPDGGAGHFAAVIRAIRQQNADIGIEVLTPDFQGNETALAHVLAAGPTVFNHNLETCERLTPQIRSGAAYRRSLQILAAARKQSDATGCLIKSGLMVGLGERDDEIKTALQDLFSAGVEIVTIGQYLPPTSQHQVLDRYVHPDVFKCWAEYALELGFSAVASSPLVRSSYQARKLAQTARKQRMNRSEVD